ARHAVGCDLLPILLGKRRARLFFGAAGSRARRRQDNSQPDTAAPNQRNAGAHYFTASGPGFDRERKPFKWRNRTQHLRLSDADADAPAAASDADPVAD